MKDSDIAQVAIVSIASIALSKWIYDWLKRDQLDVIPGPACYPVIKNPKEILALARGKQHEYNIQMVEKYGPIYYDRMRKAVIVSDAAEVCRIFNTDAFARNQILLKSVVEGLFDNALFTLPTGNTWHKHRSLLQPAFGPTHLKHAATAAEEVMKDLDSVITERMSDGQLQLNFAMVFKSLTLDIISMVAFGHKFGATLELKKDIQWFLWGLLGISKNSSSLVKKKARLHNFIDQLADKRVELIKSKDGMVENWDMDVLHTLIHEENGFTKEEMYGELLGFFFAGHESTSGTLGWILYKICLSEYEEQLYNEIKDFDLNADDMYEKLSTLQFLEKFIKEVQRMYPIVSTLNRYAVQDTMICGYSIPSGTLITIPLGAIHVNPKYYRDPTTFNPNRWNRLPEPGSYIPFGDDTDKTHLILGAIATFFAAKYFYGLYKRSKSPLHKLPGPTVYPIIANPPAILSLIKGKNYQHIQQLVAKYGDIFWTDFIGEIVVISDPTEVKRLLNSSTFERKNDKFTALLMEGLLDNALFALPSGDEWKKHRKLLQPGFGPTHLRHTGAISESVLLDFDSVVDSKLEKDSKTVIDFSTAFRSITLDVISQVAFGHKFGAALNLKNDIEWTWKEMDDYLSKPMFLRLILPKFLWNLVGIAPTSPSLLQKKRVLFDFFDRLKQERLEKINKSTDKWDMDVLERLLMEDNGMTKDDLYGELLGFFFAGHETTSGTLGFLLYKVIDEPLLGERLYNEIRDFDLKDPAAVENLSKLQFLDHFLKEVQRMYPIVGVISRCVVQDTEISGYTIPKGTIVAAAIGAMQSSPKYFKDPLIFNPDRWDHPIVPGSFMPFGDGPHNCIGQKMAVIEAKFVIIHLLQKYKFELPSGYKPNIITRPTLRIPTLPVTISKR
ncbi:hypothetical protein HDV04_000376 [Boothiomyces sp. JEL0838]|nr:hypothetical protein HDV04_000376 [Boothiomyces sp. JEL0838]